MRLHITGRLTNDRVDALVVDNPNSDNDIPHITLATAEGVKPFASNAELAANRDKIEPLDDYVDTTLKNNMSSRRRDESHSTLRNLVEQSVLSVLCEKNKKGGFNHAERGDEFYTRYKDVDREMSNYDFTGKVVYCCCDNPSSSNFVKYFRNNFDSLGLSLLMATYYSDTPSLYTYDGEKSHMRPIKSGRFQDNVCLMRMCDVVVTNPPFSKNMTRDLINTVIGIGKDLIIVGHNTTVYRKDMAEYVTNGKLNQGYSPINRFETPDGEQSSEPTAWYTTMKVKKPDFTSGRRYSESDYVKYDDYDAIEVGNYRDIPDDYYGKMGVPTGFMRVLNRDQFDVLGLFTPKMDAVEVCFALP